MAEPRDQGEPPPCFQSGSDTQYSCVLMVKSEEDFALDILEHVIWAGLFNNRRSEVALRLTTIGQSGVRYPAKATNSQPLPCVSTPTTKLSTTARSLAR